MNIIDVLIILFILLGGVIGFKQGVIKKTVSTVGLIVVIILSFTLKNFISVFLYENLPFFNFGGILKGLEVLNIILYELIAFLIVFSLLMIILRLIISLTGIVEKILKMTVILAIPSKILGFIVGLLEYYIIVFIVLFIITQPMFRIDLLNESKFKDIILNDTPLISDLAKDSAKTYTETWDIINENDNNNSKTVNTKVLEVLIKNKVITKESVNKLIEKDKLHIENANELLQ